VQEREREAVGTRKFHNGKLHKLYFSPIVKRFVKERKQETNKKINKKYKETEEEEVLLYKLTVAQHVKKFPAFMKPEGSLPCSQHPATGPYPEADKSSPQPLILFL